MISSKKAICHGACNLQRKPVIFAYASEFAWVQHSAAADAILLAIVQ